MPFPEAKISESQWAEYHKLVITAHGSTEKRHEEVHLVTYSDIENRISFAFTMKGHSAHPAWISRQVTSHKDVVSLNQIGYFAGREDAFRILFDTYERMNKETRREFEN